MKPSERMQLLSDYLKVKPIKLANITGLSRQRIRDIIVNDGQMVHPDIAKAICTKFPTISYEWIVNGTGEMVIEPEPEEPTQEEVFLANYSHAINELLAITKMQQQTIDELTEKWSASEERFNKLVETINFRNGVISKYKEDKESILASDSRNK